VLSRHDTDGSVVDRRTDNDLQEDKVARTYSTMAPLGMNLPSFELTDVLSGRRVSESDFAEAPALLVMFLCNHCPYVRHVRDGLGAFGREYQERGLALVGIASNDVNAYPQDGPEGMRAEAAEAGYAFPYLFDVSQEVAKAFQAACTPDFFLFDRERRLAYRGQFDGSRPSNDVPVTGVDLREAADAVLADRQPRVDQTPSIGCNIKWLPGKEPEYFG
jgi:thiol-disulfide isomerase/thioredoxin